MRFGELNGNRSARGEALLAACEAAGIEAEFTDDIEKVLWNKFIPLCAVSGMTSVTRASVGELRDEPATRALIQQAIGEVVTVARARGVNLDAGFDEEAMRRLDHMPADGRSSMAVDLARGNRLELPWLNGVVVKLGRELGVETPVNQFIYAALKLHENGHSG
jgi:2-dehydropantoate 2-reductase